MFVTLALVHCHRLSRGIHVLVLAVGARIVWSLRRQGKYVLAMRCVLVDTRLCPAGM